MKRIVCIIICLLVPLSAFADIVEEYNLHTVNTGAKELTGTPEKEERDGKIVHLYTVTDNIKVQITFVENEPRVFSCLCFDESEASEFLAQCANCVIQIGGYGSMFSCYADVLDMFLQARAGNKTENRKTDNLVYILEKASFGYLFMIAR